MRRYIVSGDTAIRWSTVAVVAAVAAVAAVVSYRHALQVVSRYGETGLTGAFAARHGRSDRRMADRPTHNSERPCLQQ